MGNMGSNDHKQSAYGCQRFNSNKLSLQIGKIQERLFTKNISLSVRTAMCKMLAICAFLVSS